MKYDFFILTLFFLFPTLFFFHIRKDLRIPIIIVCIMGLPFAFTEPLFYPSYWEPEFLFDFGRKFRFGIEDFLFVGGLGGFASVFYGVVLNKRMFCNFSQKGESCVPENYRSLSDLTTSNTSNKLFFLNQVFCDVIVFVSQRMNSQLVKNLLIVFLPCFLILSVSLVLKIHAIYFAPVVMIVTSLIILFIRKDLLKPWICGALFVSVYYFLVCLFFAFLFPNIFYATWHTQDFLNFFVFGVPIEELIYISSAGGIATIAFPFLFDCEWRKTNNEFH